MLTTTLLPSVILAILFGSPTLMETKMMMTTNQKDLSDARAHLKEFETGSDPEQLREAAVALEGVTLAQESDPAARSKLRTECLTLWLNILRLLDRSMDPRFNPDDPPSSSVEPPPTSDGTQYPPGADPALIDDPKARAEYEKKIAENRAKIAEYKRQVILHRLNERIPPRAKEFIRDSYTSSPPDREELKRSIEKEITSPKRKMELLALLKSSQP